MRANTRHKRLQQSGRFLTAGTARAYGVGEIGPDPRRTLFFIVLGVVAVAFLSFVVYAVIVFPGVFLIWAVYVTFERSTSVVVTDRGVAILARSEFNGRPRKFVALLPAGILTDHTVQRSGRYVHLPTYQLWIRKKEYDPLVSAAKSVLASAPPPPPPPLFAATPPPSARAGTGPVLSPAQPLPPPPPPAIESVQTDPAPAAEDERGDSYWARSMRRQPEGPVGGSP
jgi:hypothetical protein